MYDQQTCGFDQPHFPYDIGLIPAGDDFSQSPIVTPNLHTFSMEAATSKYAMDIELQHHPEMDNVEQQYRIYNCIDQSTPYPPPPADLYGMLPFPTRCSSSSSNAPNLLGIRFDPSSDGFVAPQSHLRELYQCQYSLPDIGYCNLLGAGGVDHEELAINQNGGDGRRSVVKHVPAHERQKRVKVKQNFQVLKDLVPNPTKSDRASIVGDTIEYINGLKRRVSELKIALEKKRRSRIEEDHDVDINGWMSWVRRKSKFTEVDVRIIDNEVTVKLVLLHRNKINCLVFLARALDELHLHLQQLSGGLIGDYYTYHFNSKICDGSVVYASAIANKLIDVVDKQYAESLKALSPSINGKMNS